MMLMSVNSEGHSIHGMFAWGPWSSSWWIVRCFGSWSCCRHQSFSDFIFGVSFASRICRYLLEYILPSTVSMHWFLCHWLPPVTWHWSVINPTSWLISIMTRFFPPSVPLVITDEFHVHFFSPQRLFSYLVLDTSDVEFCDEVTGIVSFWWLFHAGHVCVTPILCQINLPAGLRSHLSGLFVLPFCWTSRQFDLRAFVIFEILTWFLQFY